jgi:hypothetical protein
MAVATTQNEAQLFYRTVIIIWHNPTEQWHTCLILARFLKLSWQKLGSCILLAVKLVTSQCCVTGTCRSAPHVGFTLSFQ